MTTPAVEWLMSITPKLPAIAAFVRVENAKDAVGYPDSPLWFRLEAPECAYCGELIRRGAAKRGHHHICPACAEKNPADDSWMAEEAGRKREGVRW